MFIRFNLKQNILEGIKKGRLHLRGFVVVKSGRLQVVLKQMRMSAKFRFFEFPAEIHENYFENDFLFQ